VEALVKLVGARPIIIDPEEHDSYLAAVSHLPLVLATALFSLARESQAWPELGVLAGPGFRDMTRLASGNPEMSHDICLTNRDHLTHWIDRLIEELRRYQQMIRQEDLQEELYRHFARAQLERDAFLQRPPERPRPEQQAEQLSAGEQMLRFMMGEYLTRRAREVEQMLEQRAKEDQGRLRRDLEGR
jgi:prephenate dehydrogenase